MIATDYVKYLKEKQIETANVQSLSVTKHNGIIPRQGIVVYHSKNKLNDNL